MNSVKALRTTPLNSVKHGQRETTPHNTAKFSQAWINTQRLCVETRHVKTLRIKADSKQLVAASTQQ